MRIVRLCIDEGLYGRFNEHLFPKRARTEQAAFLLCNYAADEAVFTCLDAILIQHRQFAIHSAFHLEMDDLSRAQVIKAAHDRQCSLVEAHSHPFSDAAQFSRSDFDGLRDFVPHVWWRLRYRPYGALVVTPASIDGLAWIDGPEAPERIHAIAVGARAVSTTGLSFRSLAEVYDDPIRPQ